MMLPGMFFYTACESQDVANQNAFALCYQGFALFSSSIIHEHCCKPRESGRNESEPKRNLFSEEVRGFLSNIVKYVMSRTLF